MKIGIIGTRGIPNNYGGFEQFAEYLSLGLVKEGFDVWVYNSHNHSYQESEWKGVNIIHQFDPEHKVGTFGQFIYDLNCIRDSRKRNFDIILQLGYTSSSIWNFLLPAKSILVTNMDGLEWKRTKYNNATKSFLKYAEKLAYKKSDYLIADSLGIKKYLYQTYKVDSEYIPYGANSFTNPEEKYLKAYHLMPFEYDMILARLEPENNIETILDGHVLSGINRKICVVANNHTKYGNYLKEKYKNNTAICFLGPIYDINILNNLRYYSNLYFHGHSVGGTNPSLLEAMASQALIVAHLNDFNSSILNKDAYYFTNPQEISTLLTSVSKTDVETQKIKANLTKIDSVFSWPKIIQTYKDFFLKIKQTALN